MPNWFTRLGVVLSAAETKAASTMLSVPPWAEGELEPARVREPCQCRLRAEPGGLCLRAKDRRGGDQCTAGGGGGRGGG